MLKAILIKQKPTEKPKYFCSSIVRIQILSLWDFSVKIKILNDTFYLWIAQDYDVVILHEADIYYEWLK